MEKTKFEELHEAVEDFKKALLKPLEPYLISIIEWLENRTPRQRKVTLIVLYALFLLPWLLLVIGEGLR